MGDVGRGLRRSEEDASLVLMKYLSMDKKQRKRL